VTDRLTELRTKLKAREGQREYTSNVKWLRAEIARLEAEEVTG
jgi:hypothetical protein